MLCHCALTFHGMLLIHRPLEFIVGHVVNGHECMQERERRVDGIGRILRCQVRRDDAMAQVHRTKTCQHDRRRLSAVGRYTTGQYVTRATGTMATEANFTLLVSRSTDIQLYSRFFNTLEDYQHWILLE